MFIEIIDTEDDAHLINLDRVCYINKDAEYMLFFFDNFRNTSSQENVIKVVFSSSVDRDICFDELKRALRNRSTLMTYSAIQVKSGSEEEDYINGNEFI